MSIRVHPRLLCSPEFWRPDERSDAAAKGWVSSFPVGLRLLRGPIAQIGMIGFGSDALPLKFRPRITRMARMGWRRVAAVRGAPLRGALRGPRRSERLRLALLGDGRGAMEIRGLKPHGYNIAAATRRRRLSSPLQKRRAVIEVST